MNPNKIPTQKQMLRFIKKYLPDHGTFGTADKFREIHDIKPKWIPYMWGIPAHGNTDYQVNERFCDLLDLIADRCPGNIYDPAYIQAAMSSIPKHLQGDIKWEDTIES